MLNIIVYESVIKFLDNQMRSELIGLLFVSWYSNAGYTLEIVAAGVVYLNHLKIRFGAMNGVVYF